jgi:hypothetical protein
MVKKRMHKFEMSAREERRGELSSSQEKLLQSFTVTRFKSLRLILSSLHSRRVEELNCKGLDLAPVLEVILE